MGQHWKWSSRGCWWGERTQPDRPNHWQTLSWWWIRCQILIPGAREISTPAGRSMRIWNSRVRAGLSTTRENTVSFYNLDILILKCFLGRGEMMRDRFGYVAYYRRGAHIDHLFHSPAISIAADQEWRIRRGCNTARLSSGIGWLSLLRDFLSVKRKRRLVRLKIVECINRST